MKSKSCSVWIGILSIGMILISSTVYGSVVVSGPCDSSYPSRKYICSLCTEVSLDLSHKDQCLTDHNPLEVEHWDPFGPAVEICMTNQYDPYRPLVSEKPLGCLQYAFKIMDTRHLPKTGRHRGGIPGLMTNPGKDLLDLLEEQLSECEKNHKSIFEIIQCYEDRFRKAQKTYLNE